MYGARKKLKVGDPPFFWRTHRSKLKVADPLFLEGSKENKKKLRGARKRGTLQLYKLDVSSRASGGVRQKGMDSILS